MADTFGRNIQYGGGFKPEGTTVNFSGIRGGAIVRNINISYEQAVSRIWDLGTGKCFYVAGHTNGTWSIGRIGGTGNALAGYGVCNPGTITFSGKNGMCTGGEAGNYTLHSVVTAQIGITVTSDDMIINEGIGGTFLSLSSQ